MYLRRGESSSPSAFLAPETVELMKSSTGKFEGDGIESGSIDFCRLWVRSGQVRTHKTGNKRLSARPLDSANRN